MKIKLALIASLVAMSGSANAVFFVNYQGIDEEVAAHRGPPPGFDVLADRTFKTVKHIGEGKAEMRYGYGFQLTLKETMMSILPKDWIAYIDREIAFERKVDWDGDLPWTDVLLRLGNNYGLAFIIDWKQQMVQLVPGMDVTTIEEMGTQEFKNPDNGEVVYIHTSKKLSDSGVLVVGGKQYNVKIKK